MKNVIICGLGAVGLTYAVKLRDKCNLRILVNEERLSRYSAKKPVFNGVEQNFEYILPNSSFHPDVIIIATKANGFESALEDIKNFVNKDTRILSLLNGISSEENISKIYPEAKVLKSYFIGHSAVRNGNFVTQDGVGKIVFEKDKELEEFFNECNIDYECPDDIEYSMWLKFTLNLFSNQISAILNLTFGEMKNNQMFKELAKKIIAEVKIIADKKGIKNTENLEKDAFIALSKMCDDGKTSMLQDILANRKTEVEMFAGEILRLGKIYEVATPYNQALYDLIKIKEENIEYSVHSC